MYSIREKIRRILRSSCPVCGLSAMGGDLCALCEREVRFEFDPRRHCLRCLDQIRPRGSDGSLSQQSVCETCRARPASYARAIAGMHFARPGDQLMRRYKAQGRLTDAGLFARLLWGNMQAAQPGLPRLDALVPIPSSREAMLKRGLNPAGEIARELSGLSRIPLRGGWLGRRRETVSQKNLDWQARRESVRGLYEGRLAQKGAWVGLVDDVLTTGSTLEEASDALLQAGAQGVVALVAARTLAK